MTHVAGQGKLSSLMAIGNGRGVGSRFILLLDGVTRELVALMDSGLLNPLRVGAEGGLGVRHLASPGAKVVAILGSGKHARTQIAGVANALPDAELFRVFSPTQAHRESFAAEMASWLGRRVEAVGSVEEAIRDADVVDLVNTSREPIFETSWLKPGALVLTISGRGEVPDDFLTRTRVVAPSWNILAGSLVRDPFSSAIKAGKYTREDYGADLGEVIVKGTKVRVEPGDIVDFEATAMPVLEHAATEWAYNWAVANNAGKRLSLDSSPA
jgi:ornithine cyclodeaminase/alanine dehydrogenase-like protein (mu-crystallin family)